VVVFSSPSPPPDVVADTDVDADDVDDGDPALSDGFNNELTRGGAKDSPVPITDTPNRAKTEIVDSLIFVDGVFEVNPKRILFWEPMWLQSYNTKGEKKMTDVSTQSSSTWSLLDLMVDSGSKQMDRIG